jgi:hypothetical protein
LVGIGCANCTDGTKATIVVGTHCPWCKIDFIDDVYLTGSKKSEENGLTDG